jgi:type I restriction enzyme S subunit
MKFDKNSWKIVPFSTITECVEKHDKNASQNGYNKFIGLENLNGETMKIIGYGLLENGTTFSKTFRIGDVLFAKRRPYLKKIAMAQFNGICSGDILVFRAKHNIIPKLLLLYISSDKFIQYAIKTSAGSLSPRTKWKDLAEYQILLPPPDEQAQIVELFQNIETTIEHVEQQEKNLEKLKMQLFKDLFGDKMQFGKILFQNDFQIVSFEEIAWNISERVEPKETNLKIYVGLEHLDANNLKIERTGTPDEVIGTKLKIYKGDIIFGKRRAYLRKIAISHFDGIASAHSMVLRANEKNIERRFLPYFLQSDIFMERAVQISEGSLSPTIKWKTLASQKFILPKKEKQKQLSEFFEQFDNTINHLKQQKQTLRVNALKSVTHIL